MYFMHKYSTVFTKKTKDTMLKCWIIAKYTAALQVFWKNKFLHKNAKKP